MLTLEYVGTRFHGFQKQPDVPTVQGALEAALETWSGAPVRTNGAGRTDAGVHALGQVVAFDLREPCDTGRAVKALNALLPREIAIAGIKEVPGDFDPRRDALWREYRYFVLNRLQPSAVLSGFAYHFPCGLDGELTERACAVMEGEHDFSAFRVGSGSDKTVRRVLACERIKVSSPPGLFFFRVRAESFHYRMVRTMCAAFLSVGAGRMALGDLERHLEGGAGPCVDPLPPHGLFLWEVAYPETPEGPC